MQERDGTVVSRDVSFPIPRTLTSIEWDLRHFLIDHIIRPYCHTVYVAISRKRPKKEFQLRDSSSLGGFPLVVAVSATTACRTYDTGEEAFAVYSNER